MLYRVWYAVVFLLLWRGLTMDFRLPPDARLDRHYVVLLL